MSQAVLALREGAAALQSASIDDPMREARMIMAHVMGIAADRMTLHLHDDLSDDAKARFAALIERRAAREPMAHLLGRKLFYGRFFDVTCDVLDPRGDTETLVEAALTEPFEQVLDLGTGTGCILLSLLGERPKARGLGTDISEAALAVARGNAKRLEIAAQFARSDWYEAVDASFDLIVSNPPYIAADEMEGLAPELSYEPRKALTDEADGLSAYRIICAGATEHLKAGGRLMVEIGWTQGADVAEMMRAAGLSDVQVIQDLGGRDRVVWARKSG